MLADEHPFVLVVSDDPTRRRLARQGLERAGFAVALAGREPRPLALTAHVVVLDVTGVSLSEAHLLLAELRGPAAARQVPILCWLGADAREQAASLLAAGAADVVVEPDELGMRVDILTHARRRHDERADANNNNNNNQPLLRLHLFDPLRVLVGERVVMDAHYSRRKVQALLVYLYLKRGQYVSKYEILADLWPEAERADPGRVKQTVQVLRSALEGPSPTAGWRYVLERGGAYTFNPQADRYVDLEDFEAELKLARARRDQGSPDGARRHYRRAIDIRQGPFLAEFRYDDWAAAESARVHELYLQALEEYAQLESEAAQYTAAIDLLWRAVAEDPLHESGYVELMRNLWLHGRRTDALRVYHRLRDVLARKLDVEPQAQTTALYERIRRDTAIAV